MLVAVQYPLIAVQHCCRGHTGHVGTDAWLGQRERAPMQLAVHVGGEEAHLLFGRSL